MSSRKEEKERRRQERLAQEQAHDEQARRRRLYSIVAGGALAAAAVAAIVVVVAAGGSDEPDHGGTGGQELTVSAVDPPPAEVTNLQEAAREAGCRLSNPPIEGREHLKPGDETPEYETNPPASGNHDPVPANDGAYGRDPGVKHLIHSLEHGRIVIQFDPQLPERSIAQLKGLFDEDPYHMILTPNARLDTQVAVAAWGHIATCERMSDGFFDVVRTFTERYRDKGPEFVT